MTTYYWLRCDKNWNTIAEGEYSFLKRTYYRIVKRNRFVKVARWRDGL